MNVVAISVDPPADTLPWVKKRGLTMTMLSDPDQKIIEQQFRLRNPAREELAIHAVYILDEEGKVFYRKIGKRRPMPPEFLAAIDWWKKSSSASKKMKAGSKKTEKKATSGG